MQSAGHRPSSRSRQASETGGSIAKAACYSLHKAPSQDHVQSWEKTGQHIGQGLRDVHKAGISPMCYIGVPVLLFASLFLAWAYLQTRVTGDV
jgi:hypothetical protein